MKKICCIIILLFTLISCKNFAYSQKASDIYNTNADSVLFLETQNGTGSGVIVNEDGTFITCFHVIADADFINAKTKSGKTYKVNGYRYLDPQNDIAVLTLSTKKTFKPIKISTQDILVGDSVYALANPKGLQFVFSNGLVSQLSKTQIQFSAPASSGSSGGALLNSSGELIGIIASQYNPSIAQNLNFAIPNKIYEKHLNHRKNLNSKKASWTDFLVSRATEKQLKSYRQYAFATHENATLYRYLKPLSKDTEISPDDYALWGALAFSAYTEKYNEETFLNDSKKWLNLSLENHKNIELSSYGLILTSILSSDYTNFNTYLNALKKYPKTYKYLKKSINQKNKCGEDTKCSFAVWENMNNYMGTLFIKAYPKD